MKRPLLISLLPLLSLLAGCSDELLVTGREQWVRETIPLLTEFKPTDATAPLKIEQQGHNCVRIYGYKGWIKLPGSQWVYFASCSSHDLSIADVALAIDYQGNLYACNGHVCSDLILTWPSKGPARSLRTVEDFFASTCFVQFGGRGTPRWTPVDEWKHAAPGK